MRLANHLFMAYGIQRIQMKYHSVDRNICIFKSFWINSPLIMGHWISYRGHGWA